MLNKKSGSWVSLELDLNVKIILLLSDKIQKNGGVHQKNKENFPRRIPVVKVCNKETNDKALNAMIIYH